MMNWDIYVERIVSLPNFVHRYRPTVVVLRNDVDIQFTNVKAEHTENEMYEQSDSTSHSDVIIRKFEKRVLGREMDV